MPISKRVLGKAIEVASYSGPAIMDGEESSIIANTLTDFFGYESRIIDNMLTPPQRDLLYMMEDMGIVRTDREELTLHDGRDWRCHYWWLNTNKINEFARTKIKRKQALSEDELLKKLYSDDSIWPGGQTAYTFEQLEPRIEAAAGNIKKSFHVLDAIGLTRTLTDRGSLSPYIKKIRTYIKSGNISTKKQYAQQLQTDYKWTLGEIESLDRLISSQYTSMNSGLNFINLEILEDTTAEFSNRTYNPPFLKRASTPRDDAELYKIVTSLLAINSTLDDIGNHVQNARQYLDELKRVNESIDFVLDRAYKENDTYTTARVNNALKIHLTDRKIVITELIGGAEKDVVKTIAGTYSLARELEERVVQMENCDVLEEVALLGDYVILSDIDYRIATTAAKLRVAETALEARKAEYNNNLPRIQEMIEVIDEFLSEDETISEKVRPTHSEKDAREETSVESTV